MYPAPRDSLVTGEKYPYDRKDAKTSLISVVDQLQAGIAAQPNLSLSASVVSDVDVAGAIIKEVCYERERYHDPQSIYDLPGGKCAGSRTTTEWKKY